MPSNTVRKIKGNSIHPKAEREDFKFNDYLSGLNSYCNGNPYDFAILLFDANESINDKIIGKIVASASVPSFVIDYSKLLSAFPKE